MPILQSRGSGGKWGLTLGPPAWIARGSAQVPSLSARWHEQAAQQAKLRSTPFRLPATRRRPGTRADIEHSLARAAPVAHRVRTRGLALKACHRMPVCGRGSRRRSQVAPLAASLRGQLPERSARWSSRSPQEMPDGNANAWRCPAIRSPRVRCPSTAASAPVRQGRAALWLPAPVASRVPPSPRLVREVGRPTRSQPVVTAYLQTAAGPRTRRGPVERLCKPPVRLPPAIAVAY